MANRSWPAVPSLVAAAVLSPCPGLAAAAETQQPDTILDEVLVEGQQPIKSARTGIEWLARLAGRFEVTGEVALHTKEAAPVIRLARGAAVCTGYGMAPAIQCELKIQWPAAAQPATDEDKILASTLDPATLLLGLEPTQGGIVHLLVDNAGTAEGTLGFMFSPDVMTSTAQCAGVPDSCTRRVRISAPRDLKTVEILIDVHLEGEIETSYSFSMRRLPGPAPIFSRDKK